MIEATPGRAFVVGLLTGINHERNAHLAKPATDEEITAIRMTLPEQAHQMSPAALVMQLIARIDAERDARLAAEARVKALEKLLDDLDMYLDGPVPWNGDGRLIAEIIRKCRAALKEPANG